MTTRRQALGALFLPVLPAACTPRGVHRVGPGAAPIPAGRGSPDELARDEDYWAQVASAFTIDRSAINLNNGAVSPAPRIVQEAMARHLAVANSTPMAHALWIAAPPLQEAVRQRLATHWG